MMLSGESIAKEMCLGRLVIRPFNSDQLNPNSYNLRLAHTLLVYDDMVLYSNKENRTHSVVIPSSGYTLQPGELYLGSTVEYTETHPPFVPAIEGRSSLGRLGLSVHSTAGFGDCGFCGCWTLELSVVKPLVIYPGMLVCQIAYVQCTEPVVPYKGKYQQATGAEASKLYKEMH